MMIILSFGAACTIVIKKQINKSKEKLIVLQSIGIIVIESNETRVVTYTCRYSSGSFISTLLTVILHSIL